MELLELFLAGFALGLAVCWVYIRSLKAALKTCEAYIHERIDSQFKEASAQNTASDRR